MHHVLMVMRHATQLSGFVPPDFLRMVCAFQGQKRPELPSLITETGIVGGHHLRFVGGFQSTGPTPSAQLAGGPSHMPSPVGQRQGQGDG